jgi:class 3 adenylate cyclase
VSNIPEKEEMTCSTKYIFLDIVKFTHRRNVEAQSDIVRVLNRIVRESIKKNAIDAGTPIYIPTGDGICIAFKNTEGRYPFDIHMQIALDILAFLHGYNDGLNEDNDRDELRRFQIRIGLNANEDNLITDINGRENVAGAGISLASRIMDKADGNQLLVGESVYDRLQQRQKYMDKFKAFSTVDKHGKPFKVYQFIDEGHAGLNIDVPKIFKPKATNKEEEPRLGLQMACYFAHAIKNREFFLKRKDGLWSAKVILLWMLASDSVREFEAKGLTNHSQYTYKAGEASLGEQLDFYLAIHYGFSIQIGELIMASHLSKFIFYFEEFNMWFINPKGQEKLKHEWSDIWDKFGLNNI